MIIKFDKEYLKELFEDGKCSNKKYRFQPEVVTAYGKRVLTLMAANSVEDLYPIGALHYEVLVGDKKGISSIRINKKYRLEFKVDTSVSGETVITFCTLTEISNHYK
ncbi:MAG: type II toxin-antitoxin system RelE/ParE family toxin [Rikenellaceae bacterium]